MPDFLKAAKNGNIGALEALMNKSFGSQGVVAHIGNVNSTLKVTLKTPDKPGPDKKLVIRVKAGLDKISPKGFDKVFVCAKTLKSDKAIWSLQWAIQSSKKNSQVTPLQVLDTQKRASDFKVAIPLTPPQVPDTPKKASDFEIAVPLTPSQVPNNQKRGSDFEVAVPLTPLQVPEIQKRTAVPLTPLQVLDTQKRASDFEMEVYLEGPRKWVFPSILGVTAATGLGFWWLARSEAPNVSTTSSSPSTIAASTASQKPKEPAATPSEIQVFTKLVALIDPQQMVITQIQQHNDTEFLYLTVGQGFVADDKSNQGDLAIRLRDSWNKICGCYGQLLFQSAGGQELVYISASGEPRFNPK
ncbi:MAG: hypothetical protein AAGI69_01950 [Cyanobacteria bacterium P01_H01_bin.21]